VTDLAAKCRPIELLLSDVDGVMTNGHIVYDNQGIETKQFHVRDGIAIKLWDKSGNRFGIITQRSSHAVKIRASELSVSLVRQGAADKIVTLHEIVEKLGLELDQVGYIGDDLPDLPVLRAVGLGVAVADAVEEVRQAADFVTSLPGGQGAVRETVEMILKSQQRWEDLVRSYEG
jgi:3-deoxy-D-manno-octulosonate 8-phosphate phosphatase (KDO 8-P phosphatase)